MWERRREGSGAAASWASCSAASRLQKEGFSRGGHSCWVCKTAVIKWQQANSSTGLRCAPPQCTGRAKISDTNKPHVAKAPCTEPLWPPASQPLDPKLPQTSLPDASSLSPLPQVNGIWLSLICGSNSRSRGQQKEQQQGAAAVCQHSGRLLVQPPPTKPRHSV